MAKSQPSFMSKINKMIKDNNVEMVDLKFTDLIGQWQHLSVPIDQLEEDSFTNGFGFDGSSMRGWKSINESDMILVPDPNTALVDPFVEMKTLSFVCNIFDPITKEPYLRCPRNIARKAEAYVKSTGLADVAYFGPEAEFFIFDDIRFEQSQNKGYYYIDSVEGEWNSGREEFPNLGYKPRFKEGYFPVPPVDSQNDLRNQMVKTLKNCGIEIEAQHHEVATGGQAEIDMKFTTLVNSADNIMLYKYIVKNVAVKNNKTVTFMPKPLFGDNGSGMHVHQSLWKKDKPLFYGNKYANLSDMALWYIGGLLKHAPALLAITNPITNSYRRLVPGFEAPVNLAYSQRNRSASIRIPVYDSSPKAKRIEFRCPDPSCNPYLSFAALLLAGLDGIRNRIDPGDPLDKNIYDLAPEEAKNVPTTPGSLGEALEALRNDHEFLLQGNVFTEDLIQTWIDYKYEKEVKPVQLRPTPYEFVLYYDV